MAASPPQYDAVVVGAGVNGLSAAVVLAEAGRSVLVLEAAPTIGGATRTAELTLPGYHHDVCSAIHPIGALSPLFRRLPLADHGLEWCTFPASIAHPLDDHPAVIVTRDFEATGAHLGPDAARYRRLIQPFSDRAEALFPSLLGPLRFPRHPFLMARFGWYGLRSARGLARSAFRAEPARALLAGCAAHSILPLTHLGTAAVGLVFAVSAHATDWPCARGGSRAITDALASYLRALGGEIRTDHRVTTLGDIPPHRVALFDTSPRQLLAITGDHLPASYRRRLGRFHYGPGVFKVDWALDGPIPWADPACATASTVHVGGTLDEIATSEADAWAGRHTDRPFLLVCQQSTADPTRAPAGRHTGYAYCHVPYGSDVDMTDRVEAQIERFAPGFRDRILARATRDCAALEADNANCVGGTIAGGAANLGQLFTRPVARLDPYGTPDPALFFCSASTPPGGGVHGMCGDFAARSALRGRLLR